MGPKKAGRGGECDCEQLPRGSGGTDRVRVPDGVGGEQSSLVVGSSSRPARTRGLYRAGKTVERATVAASWSTILLTPGDWLVYTTTDLWIRQAAEGQASAVAQTEIASGQTVPSVPGSGSYVIHVGGNSEAELAHRAVSVDGRIRVTRYDSVDT